MSTPFSEIMRVAVERTPGAIAGAMAAQDGEIVDSFTTPTTMEWELLTAHYGIVFSQVRKALLTFHWGEGEFVMLTHADLDIVIQSIDDGYYAIMALSHPAPMSRAMSEMGTAVELLRQEMA